MFASALLLAAVTSAPPPSPAASVEDAVALAVTKRIESQHPVGAAVGVAKDGKLIYVKTFGLRNIAKSAPVDKNTRFEIGSVTKQFTAAAILQLQERGKLHIDDRLAKYLPSFPHAGEITLRQLLNQVTGFEDYLDGNKPLAIKDLSQPGNLAKVAARVDVPLHFKPGTRWEYSNTNYYVLGKIIENVSHQTYDDYVREHIFGPAGMTHSDFMANAPTLADFAVGYWTGLDGRSPLQPAPTINEGWSGGAGGIVSTISDMVAWDNALTTGKIVTPADYTLMSTPARLANGKRDDYGMGLGINPLDGHDRIWHNGGSLGSFTMNAIYPKDHLEIVSFENSAGSDPGQLEASVVEAMFPDAAVAAKTPGAHEDPAVHERVLHLFKEVQQGTLQANELAPDFAKIATPSNQKTMAARISALGDPTVVIYKETTHEGGDTSYLYRLEFASGAALRFMVDVNDKTNLVAGIGFRPW